jgi:hypothetical protein
MEVDSNNLQSVIIDQEKKNVDSKDIQEEIPVSEQPEKTKRKNKNKNINIQSNCTSLLFINTDGSRYEKQLIIKVQSYSELQREIARLTPKNRQLYIVQDEKGNRINSEDFVPRLKFIVRCLSLKPPEVSRLRGLPHNWELVGYHEVRLAREAVEKAEKEAKGVTFL